jgi:hypothetical protein
VYACSNHIRSILINGSYLVTPRSNPVRTTWIRRQEGLLPQTGSTADPAQFHGGAIVGNYAQHKSKQGSRLLLRENKVQVIVNQMGEILLSIDARTAPSTVKCGSTVAPEIRRQIPVDSPDPLPGASIIHLPYNTLKLPSLNLDLERRRPSVSLPAAPHSFARLRQLGSRVPHSTTARPRRKENASLSIFIATGRGPRGLGEGTRGIFGLEPQQPPVCRPVCYEGEESDRLVPRASVLGARASSASEDEQWSPHAGRRSERALGCVGERMEWAAQIWPIRSWGVCPILLSFSFTFYGFNFPF